MTRPMVNAMVARKTRDLSDATYSAVMASGLQRLASAPIQQGSAGFVISHEVRVTSKDANWREAAVVPSRVKLITEFVAADARRARKPKIKSTRGKGVDLRARGSVSSADRSRAIVRENISAEFNSAV